MNLVKKITYKYSKIPVQARASFWFLVCGILQNGLNIITLPVFTRLLTTNQYGLSSTYFAWNDLFVVICTLRLSYGVFDKGMIRYSDKRDKFESSLLGLTTVISLTMLILFLFFHSIVEKMIGMSFTLCLSLFICQIFAPSLLFWTARNKYEYKYQKFTIVTLATVIICTFFNLIAVIFCNQDRGVVKILSYQAIWSFVNIFFYIYIFYKGKIFYDKDIWRYALKFNLPLIPYFLSTLILDKADRIMIGNFCGNGDVALYSVSYNLGRLMVLLTSSLDATLTPWIYQKIKNKEFKNSKKISVCILVAMMVCGSLFMLFAPELVTIFANEKYRKAVYVIPPVIASYFFVMLYHLVSKIEFYYERTKTIAKITALAAVLDIILNYFFIPKFGYIAAGYTTLFCYIIMAILHTGISFMLAEEKKIEKEIFPWKKFCLLSVIMLGITILVNILYQWLYIRYFLIFVIVIISLLARKKIIDMYYLLKER